MKKPTRRLRSGQGCGPVNTCKYIIIIFISIFALNNLSRAQFSISVKPSLNLYGENLYGGFVGYKVGNVVPFGGIQYVKGSFTIQVTGKDYDYSLGQLVDVDEETKVSAGIYMPFIGAKYFIISKEDVKAYVVSIIAKPFVTGSSVTDGKEDEDFKEAIKNIKLWGFQEGLGGEYFISGNFSFGAEFGIKFFYFKTKNTIEDTDTVYDPVTGTTTTYNSTRDYVYKLNLGFTYTSLSFNYYF